MKCLSIVTHFAAAIIVTGIMLTMYATVQQVHRSAANDPQLQLAGDITARISSSRSFDQLLPDDTIDISKSLGTFVTLYNPAGNPVQSTGLLDGKLPQLPRGVFEFARNNHEDVFTWQPRSDVRVATVLQATSKGFIAVGRSLQQVEIREENLVTMILITWVACLGVILLHWIIQIWLAKKNTR